jgi:large subunit ribosomal protein L10
VALNLAQKQTIVGELSKVVRRSGAVIVVDYRGLLVKDMTPLRAKARQSGVHIQVARNTLTELAFKGTPFECLNDTLKGPVMLVFSGDEVSAGARLIRDFAKTNDKLKVKAIALGGQLLDGKQLEAVATMPTRDEGISLLLAVMQAPIAKFVQTLAAPHTKFVRTLAAVRDQKQSQ